MLHVVSSENGIQGQSLFRPLEHQEIIKLTIYWRGVPVSGDTSEPVESGHEDLPQLLENILARRHTLPSIS